MSRTREFERIKAAYKERDTAMLRKGQLPMRSTAKGFWGVSNLDDVYAWFEKMSFAPGTRFCDLGCGDGRVTLVASLFVDASGIEFDEELARVGQEVARELGLTARIIAGDIHDHDLSGYDALYMYADQNLNYFREQLLEQLRGTLYLYHDTYHPDYLTKGRITWVGQIPIHSYTLE